MIAFIQTRKKWSMLLGYKIGCSLDNYGAFKKALNKLDFLYKIELQLKYMVG